MVVDALVADYEVALTRRSRLECAFSMEVTEKVLDLATGLVPGDRPVVLEQQPARPLFDARHDVESRPSSRERRAVVRHGCTGSGEAARPDRTQRIDASVREPQSLTLTHMDRWPKLRTQHGLVSGFGTPRPAAVYRRPHAFDPCGEAGARLPAVDLGGPVQALHGRRPDQVDRCRRSKADFRGGQGGQDGARGADEKQVFGTPPATPPVANRRLCRDRNPRSHDILQHTYQVLH